MSFKKTLLAICFFMISVPPPGRSASSDAFPWSSTSNLGNNGASGEVSPGVRRDAYGALRDSTMLPDTAPYAVQQNPISTTNSLTLPLFTPARNSGANQPTAALGATNSPSMETGVIAPGGTVSPSGIAQGNVGPTQSGPGAAGLFTPSSPGNAAAYDAQVHGGLSASPIVDGNGANVRVTVPTLTPSTVPNYQQASGPTYGGARPITSVGMHQPSLSPGNLDLSGTTRIPDANLNPAIGRVPQVSPASRSLTATHTLRRNYYPVQRHIVPSHQVPSIGIINGEITYEDGQKVLFGSEGTASVNLRKGVVAMPNGAVLPLTSAGRNLRRVAEKSQIRL